MGRSVEVVTINAILRELAREGGRLLHREQVRRALTGGRLTLPGLVRFGNVLGVAPEHVQEAKRRLMELETAPTRRQREQAASGAA